MLFVVGAMSIVAGLWFAVVAAILETGALGQLMVGLLLLAAGLFATLAVASMVIAARFANGGNGVRVGAVVIGSLIVTGSAVTVMTHHGAWGVGGAVGILVIVLSTREDTRDWFARPHQ
ncbi:hypothetical protein [Streptomyces sp. NPDC002889]|uniref:hypothetical protein n=1 Tax=Streptomyces sp. NPDC002889 TaxID=3364669 RepID=UPI00368C6885